MEATKLKNLRESNTFTINNVSLLKSAVVYGANASGKSSLLDALSKMRNLIEHSLDIGTTKKYIPQPFLLNSETETKETFFECEFIINKILYRYGFNISINATITKEWLYQKKLQVKARETRLFERELQKITLGVVFKEGKNLFDKTKDNTLFLTVVAQFNGQISQDVLAWFSYCNILSCINSNEFENFSFNQLKDKDFKEQMINFIKKTDVGIYGIESKHINLDELKIEDDILNTIPNELVSKIKEEGILKIETQHMQYDKDNIFKKLKSFDLEFESDGTQKLLALTAPVIATLSEGATLIIDELDNSLHTELVEAIIKLFNSKETNPNNAQLIFSTHDTNLLNQELFRRDQIWFTQKDIYGVSELYSLVEYGKGKTRDDLALEKNYLDGKFGAVPHISSLGYEVD